VKYNVEEVASLSEQEMVKPLHFREFLMGTMNSLNGASMGRIDHGGIIG